MDWAAHEPVIRISVFATILVAMLAWEWLAPKRVPHALRWRRGWANLGLSALSTIVARVVVPGITVVGALTAAERAWGVFHLVQVPAWIALVVSFVVLDVAIYAQHILTHKIPLLWRLHRVHHGDPMIDATTGLRFHPVEIIGSLLIKVAVVMLLGAPVAAVVVFEVVLNATTIFNHSNVRMPVGLDRWLRWVVVTPDMHRVHHSQIRDETNSNFGFNLPWWDRIFRTYRAQPLAGHLGMDIGLPAVTPASGARWWWLVLSPFTRQKEP